MQVKKEVLTGCVEHSGTWVMFLGAFDDLVLSNYTYFFRHCIFSVEKEGFDDSLRSTGSL